MYSSVISTCLAWSNLGPVCRPCYCNKQTDRQTKELAEPLIYLVAVYSVLTCFLYFYSNHLLTFLCPVDIDHCGRL